MPLPPCVSTGLRAAMDGMLSSRTGCWHICEQGSLPQPAGAHPPVRERNVGAEAGGEKIQGEGSRQKEWQKQRPEGACAWCAPGPGRARGRGWGQGGGTGEEEAHHMVEAFTPREESAFHSPWAGDRWGPRHAPSVTWAWAGAGSWGWGGWGAGHHSWQGDGWPRQLGVALQQGRGVGG